MGGGGGVGLLVCVEYVGYHFDFPGKGIIYRVNILTYIIYAPKNHYSL